MDEVQIEDIQPQSLHAVIKRLERRIKTLVDIPQLGGDEDLFARHFRGPQSLAYAHFVDIDGGGVDVPIARGERSPDDGGGAVRRRLENSKTELRN